MYLYFMVLFLNFFFYYFISLTFFHDDYMKTLLLLLFLCPCFLPAQSGFSQWTAVQGTELHLNADCKEKKIFASESGKEQDLALRQVQTFKNGRLTHDLMYQVYPELIIFDMEIEYKDDQSAEGFNILDSSRVTYSFTKENKIRYYVVDNQTDVHVIYTYNDTGLLIRCKDCLDPYGGHQWCAYYSYIYDKNNNLIKIESSNLEKGQPVGSKTLFAVDSLVYQNNLLRERYSLKPSGNTTQQAIYSYDLNGNLIKEVSAQSPDFVEPRSYTKLYDYYKDNQLKLQTESYYKNKELQGRQIISYDKKGRKIKQESFRGDGSRTKLYTMKYK
jgi:hypothetical protein